MPDEMKGQAADENDAEMDGIDPKGHHDREQHGSDDHDDCQGLHEHAYEHQEYHDENPDHGQICREVQQTFGNHVRNSVLNEDSPECIRCKHDDENPSCQP